MATRSSERSDRVRAQKVSKATWGQSRHRCGSSLGADVASPGADVASPGADVGRKHARGRPEGSMQAGQAEGDVRAPQRKPTGANVHVMRGIPDPEPSLHESG
jgi:hypothetical protein